MEELLLLLLGEDLGEDGLLHQLLVTVELVLLLGQVLEEEGLLQHLVEALKCMCTGAQLTVES